MKTDSDATISSDKMMCCACCGIAAVDDIKLKMCDDGCDLVKYCGDECQENHREQHEEECNKRKAELHDKQLFTQPDESYLGECPICCLPLSIRPSKSTMMSCCCKTICNGCNYANQMREIKAGLEHRCAFCREPIAGSEEECNRQLMERIKKHNDPVAMIEMGKHHYGEEEYGKTFEYLAKATKLGEMAAHSCLGDLYYQGFGVKKDMKRAIYHWEQAAIGGDPVARGRLAHNEVNNERFDRAAKHFTIAANLGDEKSLQEVKALFVDGKVSKEEYAAALRGYQAAVDATKSPEREKAEHIAEQLTRMGLA